MRFNKIKIIATLITISTCLYGENPEWDSSSQVWGLGFIGRYASVPYIGEDGSVSDMMPVLYFENRYLYLDGLEYGLKAYEDRKWRASFVAKLRYVDMPKKEQNKYLEDALDAGVALRYKLHDSQFIEVAAMSDLSDRYYGYLKYGTSLQYKKLSYRPYAQLGWSDAAFNRFYYGHNEEEVGSGFDVSAGINARYHLVSNLYLIGGLEGKYLGDFAKKSSYLDDNFEASASLGFAFMGMPRKFDNTELTTSPYIRLEHGWATPSDLADILTGKAESDIDDNQLTSIFYGHPVGNELFGLPIDTYLTAGLVHHHASDVQKSSQEYVLALKWYYTTRTKYRVRFGVAEGISYAKGIPYIESHEMQEKGYKDSNLMNYADFTVGVNLGDIFSSKLDGLWLGAGIHHRSSMFESSSMFGRIKGGSNYNGIYVQWHF